MLRPLVLALALLTASPALAEPVVAVLYFDNHTGEPAFDVLQKGLADMLVTDLAATGGLTVVERSRFEALVTEQALQQTAFFDPKTAVTAGRGLGATHVLTGSLVAVAPTLRIDARLIEVQSGTIVTSAQVSGPSDDVFALEQALVTKLAAALAVSFAPAPLPATKVKDLPTLVEYSKAIDLADRGEVEPARKAFDALVKKAPAFGLARVRRDELVARLASSIDRRVQVRRAAEDTIMQRAEALLGSRGVDTTLSEAEVTRALGLRVLMGRVLIRRMRPLLSDAPRAAPLPGKEAALEKHMLAWLGNQRTLIRELDLAAARFPSLDSVFFEGEDEALRATADLGRVTLDVIGARGELARFVLLGDNITVEPSLLVAPPLGALRPAERKLALELLADAVALGDRKAADATAPWDAFRARELWGDYLLQQGDYEGAVAKWQEALDRYPAAPYFKNLERRIKRVLGLESDHRMKDLARWQRGLANCTDNDLRPALDEAFEERFDRVGIRGIAAVVSEVEQACKDAPKAKGFWEHLNSQAALEYGRHHYCAEFEAHMRRYTTLTGDSSSVEGWRKHYTKCPVP